MKPSRRTPSLIRVASLALSFCVLAQASVPSAGSLPAASSETSAPAVKAGGTKRADVLGGTDQGLAAAHGGSGVVGAPFSPNARASNPAPRSGRGVTRRYPAPALPNLDRLRSHQRYEPKAPQPVPSKRPRRRGQQQGGQGGVPAENGGSGNTEARPGVGELVPMKFGPQGPTVELAASGARPAPPVAVSVPLPESALAGVSDSPGTLSLLGRGVLNFITGGAMPAVASLFVSQNNATFVSQSVPPVMQPGHTYSVSVTMHNSGGTTWDAAQSYRLGSRNPQDNNTWGTGRVNLAGQVAPGGDATFSFQITAPSTSGIYNFQWEMVQDGVEWFGASSDDLAINVTDDGTYTPAALGSVIISEFRMRGPNGAADEYVELYNATTQPLTVGTADGSQGWALVSSDGVVRFVVPAGTVIPARGHYLAADQAYSLSSYAAPDLAYASDIPDNSGIALFRTAQPSNFTADNRLDAVGFSGAGGLYYEGTPLNPVATNVSSGDGQSAFYRNLASGLPSDSNNNAADFVLVSTTACVGPVSASTGACGGTLTILGAPNPDDAYSPVNDGRVKPVLLDPAQASYSQPNQVRDYTPLPNFPRGTLSFRRTYINYTGATVTRLRFHVVDATTLNYGGGYASPADLRLISSPAVTVTRTDGTSVPVVAMTLDEPPAQGLGGGMNSTVTATLGGGVAPGNSVNVQLRTAVAYPGSFRFLVTVEEVTRDSVQAVPPTSDSFAAARVDPANRTGGSGVDLRSGNYNWGLPLISLPGRAGLDLGLSLAYNSRVWTKSGSYVAFDADNGTPSPGFRLGFPTIQPRFYDSQTGKSAYLLITPNGDHVELRQTATGGVYESADSSHLQVVEGAGVLTLLPTDGSRMLYSMSGGEYHCTRVTDRNGNYLGASYDGLGNIQTITDTLGRAVTFNYDQYGNLSYISRPVWNPQTQQSEQRQWVTFGWDDLTVQTNFSGLTTTGVQNGWTIPVLTQVGLPDGSLYRFDYTPWAQVTRVSRYTLASDTPPANPQYPQDYAQRSSTYYGVRGDGGAETDCPRVINTSTTAENWIGGAQAITWFSYGGDEAAGVWGEATMPDQTRYRETYGTAYKRGLVVKAESFAANDPAGSPHKTVTAGWTQDNENLGYELNPRPTRTEITDSDGNHRLTTVEYDTSEFKLPVNVREYDKDETTVLRRTNTTYITDSAYVSRRIIGLPSVVSVFDGSDALVSKTDYLYDQADEQGAVYLQDADNGGQTPTVQHDTTYGVSLRAGRADLNVVRRWDVTDINTAGDPTLTHKTKMGYDTNGSVLFSEDAAGHRTIVSYADSFSVAAYNGGSRFAYPTTVTDPDGYSSKAIYDFDFGAVTQAQSPMPNQTAAGVYGPTTTVTYDSIGRPVQVNNSFNAAQTRTVYPASLTSAQSYTSIQDEGAPLEEAYALQAFDGVGRVLGTSRNMAAAGRYSGRQFVYDIMGRLIQQSNPTEMTGDWAAAGDDAPANGGNGWVYSQQQYDWKGRPTVTTNQDGTQKTLAYGGCGCAGGEIVTATDEVGRTQKIYHDALGRVVKAEVLNQDAAHTVYSATTTKYNALDQVTRVRTYQGASPDPEDGSGTYQEASSDYDGYGRLKTSKAPAQSDVTRYAYFDDGATKDVTDARGVTRSFTYNGRHLVNGISYDRHGIATVSTEKPSGAGTTDVADVPAVTYSYDAAGNRTSMATGDGGGVNYSYDQLSRLSSEARTFPGLSGVGYALSYAYTVAGRLKSVTDQGAGTTFANGYDAAGQLADVTGTGYATTQPLASNLQYRASGAAKAVSYGNGTSLALSYDARGILSHYGVNGVTADGNTGPAPHGSDFSYYADGRVKFAADLFTDSVTAGGQGLHDRAYSYDHVGRLQEAYSGYEANAFIGRTGTAPQGAFRQSYSYDVWGDQTGRTGRFWSEEDNDSESYDARGRNTAWEYDPNGRMISRNEPSPNGLAYEPLRQAYDAAGRLSVTTQMTARHNPNPNINTIWTTRTTRVDTYDGDGVGTKQATTTQLNSNQPGTSVTYYLRSSVLGGRVIAELDGAGNRQNSYAYAGGERVIRQQSVVGASPQLFWQHENPVTGDTMETDAAGAAQSKETLDPMGVNVGDTDPFVPADPEGGSGDTGGGMTQAQMDAKYAQLMPNNQVLVDGFATSWAVANAVISSGAGVQCPDNVCEKFIHTSEGTAYATYRAYADGMRGYLPTYVGYTGDGFTLFGEPWIDLRKMAQSMDLTLNQLRARIASGSFDPSPQQTRSDCARLVDQFIAAAEEEGIGFRTIKKVTLGRSMGLAAKNTYGKGHDDPALKDKIDGFKPYLIAGGQGADIYKHLIGIAGAVLIGNRDVAAGIKITPQPGARPEVTGWGVAYSQLDADKAQLNDPKHHDEAEAEVADDWAGIDIGKWMGQAIDGSIGEYDLRRKIFPRICDH